MPAFGQCGKARHDGGVATAVGLHQRGKACSILAQLSVPSSGVKKPLPKLLDWDPHTVVGDALAVAARTVMMAPLNTLASSTNAKKGTRVLSIGDSINPSLLPESLDCDTHMVIKGTLAAKGGSSAMVYQGESRWDSDQCKYTIGCFAKIPIWQFWQRR